ncbi:bifunctional ligase/repressor BirA [Peptococcaceae bacterium CEB3]|nr:bifunctional ligase/repressor BirA [Peptococcaceae bacterium CEB3]
MGRKEILDILAEWPGEFVSGERISKSLHATRAAVWKQIQALKASGYEIEGVTKSGYRLLSTPLDPDEWAIAHELRSKTLGHPLYLFDELSSTNDWAHDAVKQGADHGLTVMARRQVKGRGRLGRYFESPAGGLWFSVVLKPKLSLADAAKLTLSASLAVVDGIRAACGVAARIKWPNDIVYRGRKLAGILGEVSGEWTTLQSIVLGIGINCNLRKDQFPQDIPAETLLDLTGTRLNLNILAARVLESLEYEVETLEREGFASARERWLANAWGVGDEVLVRRGAEVFAGRFQGISAEGELLLQSLGGVMSFSAGEVQLRAPAGEYSGSD